MTQSDVHYEIERKYLITMPDIAVLKAQNGVEIVQIRQDYLSGTPGGRLRAATTAQGTVYIHTVKQRLTDATRIEQERLISFAEYQTLLRDRDPALRTIEKTRYRIPFRGLVAEVDLFPFWQDRAVVEFELENETQQPQMPDWLHVVREVTHDRRYTNLALAREVPMDALDIGPETGFVN